MSVIHKGEVDLVAPDDKEKKEKVSKGFYKDSLPNQEDYHSGCGIMGWTPVLQNNNSDME